MAEKGIDNPYTLDSQGVECSYFKECTDYRKKCDSCKHNRKRSYYEAIPVPYVYPWYPWYWNYWPWQPAMIPYCTTTISAGTSFYIDDLK